VLVGEMQQEAMTWKARAASTRCTPSPNLALVLPAPASHSLSLHRSYKMEHFFGFIRGYIACKMSERPSWWLPVEPIPLEPKQLTLLRMVDPSQAHILTSVDEVMPRSESIREALDTLFAQADSLAGPQGDWVVFGIGFNVGKSWNEYSMHFIRGPRNAVQRELVWAKKQEEELQRQMDEAFQNVIGARQEGASTASSSSSSSSSDGPSK